MSNKSTIRVLQIIGKMNMGGAETFIMNMYRNIDRSKVQFDFVIHTEEECAYNDEIRKLGGRIYSIVPISKNPIKHMKQLKKIIQDNGYETVHRHTNTAIVWIDLLIAKICKVKNIIIHSHNTKSSNNFAHKICRPFLKIANIKYACSIEAGQWLYGKNEKFEIIHNGINLDEYQYKEEKRNYVREQLNIDKNELIIGHVGRFNKQKNHEFLIRIFKEITKINNNSKLLLIGVGELQEQIKEQTKKLEIENKVIFLNMRKDVSDILQAMDIFLFPSLYEGLPLTLIEAQASGLPIFASNTISHDCNLTKSIVFLDLQKTESEWAKIILETKRKRKNSIEMIRENGYDAIDTAKKLEKIYIGG